MKHTQTLKFTIGFTLIELLIIISLFGLLAVLVLANLSAAKTKAIVAAGKAFEASTYHTLGAYTVADWHLDESSGGSVSDSSGNGYNGNISRPTWTTGISGNALSFNGVSSVVIVNNSSVGNFAATDPFTVAAWIYPTYANAYQGIVSRDAGSGLANVGWVLMMDNKSVLSFYLLHGPSNYVGGSASTTKIKLNQWSYVTATYNGPGLTQIYVNGEAVPTANSQSGTIGDITGNRPLYFGYSPYLAFHAFFRYFEGKIDEVKIFSNSLLASNVHQLYAEGLPTHALAENK